jgi:hypothetical protein
MVAAELGGLTMTDAKLIEAARCWLLECGADEDDVADATDARIVREVSRQYDGGWSAFVVDDPRFTEAR